MSVRFVDTHYLLALLNRADEAHAAAAAASRQRVERLVTTTWVLIEFADAMSAAASRGRAARLISGYLANPLVTIIRPEWDQFEAGLRLYAARRDKGWSLTDCLSFEEMRRMGIREALTGDHHFEQAGFVALLRATPGAE